MRFLGAGEKEGLVCEPQLVSGLSLTKGRKGQSRSIILQSRFKFRPMPGLKLSVLYSLSVGTAYGPSRMLC